MRDVTGLKSEAALLERLEEYYDAVPRGAARVEGFGPLTLFVREGAGWPFYARPAWGWMGAGVAAADVLRVRERQRELGLPESFEWVAETAPALRAAAEEAGLTAHEHPLMVLAPQVPAAVPEPPAGVRVRVLGADDPALPAALAVPHLAFAEPGTAPGVAGAEHLAAEVRARAGDGSVARKAARIRAGLTVVAAAVDDAGTVLCSGEHQPVGEVTEVVAVGTLPAARRRGLALAVTATLVADARARGATTVFLSAADPAVARVYGRLGFVPVGTAITAEPAPAPAADAAP